MSKSAIAALTKAQEIIAAAGVNVNLTGYITDAGVRKNWRNADALATLLINSAANAFQCEDSTTFADNFFDNMEEAVERYVSANLDDWNGKSWVQKDTAAELGRLADMVARNVMFEADAAHTEALAYNAQFDSVEYPTVTKECFHEARDMNRYVGNADLLPQSGFCQADRDYLLAVNARLHPDLLAFDVSEAHAEAREMNVWMDRAAFRDELMSRHPYNTVAECAHAEALEVNALVDEAVFLSTVFADNTEYDRHCAQQSVERIRYSLLNLKRYNAFFILKMMISVRRLAGLARVTAAENYRAMMARCAAAGEGCNEIPF